VAVLTVPNDFLDAQAKLVALAELQLEPAGDLGTG
jgi:hypothetical protein